jgi:NAD(P)H dehydrogenase (quinone)
MIPTCPAARGTVGGVTRIAVIYYSATGNVHALARAVAEGAADEGAEVRLRHVAELPEEMLISFKQYWGRHRSELEDQPDAALEDLEWADGIAFGTPTRFGNVAAQLKLFLDLAGELWQQGKLIDKVATAFTSAQTEHGGHESTILALNNTLYHWGAIVLPLGYTAHEAFNGGATRTALRSRATTTSRGRTKRRCSSHERRAHGLRAWRA